MNTQKNGDKIQPLITSALKTVRRISSKVSEMMTAVAAAPVTDTSHVYHECHHVRNRSSYSKFFN